MNIIDALFITLSLDTKDYEKKQKEVTTSLTKMGDASDKQTKLIAESGKKAAGAFSLLKVEVLGALAAFGMGAGFKSFIESSMMGQAQLGRLSTTLGVSTHALQAWKLAAKEMGGSGGEAMDALQTVAKGMAEAKIHGTSALIQASRRFGFGVSNDPTQTLINISRRMSQMHDPQQALQVAEAAGISNFTMQQMLLQGPDKLQAQLARTMGLTGAATKSSTEQAARLQAQWADLQERFRQVGERVFYKLEPILAKLGEKLANWIDRIDWNKVIASIGHFIDKVQEVVKEMGGWKTVAEILGGVLALKVLMPVIALVSNFGRLIPLLAGGVGSVTGIALAFGSLGVALAAAGGAYLGLKASGALDDAAKKSTGNKDETFGTYLYERYNPFNPASGKREFSFWKGASATDESIRKNTDEERQWMKQTVHPTAADAALGSDFLGTYDPMKSRKFGGNNASLFSTLEQRYGLPAGTLTKKFAVESANGTRLKSPAGAVGPMQFMQGTAKDMGLTFGPGGNVMDLDDSAEAAAKYLQRLHNQFGDWDKAQAAYNWGPGNLKKDLAKHGNQWLAFAPSETQKYVSAHRLLQSASPVSAAAQRQGSSTSTNTVSINTLNVNAPKATDANGIVKGMKTAMRSNPLIAGSVTALA